MKGISSECLDRQGVGHRGNEDTAELCLQNRLAYVFDIAIMLE
jgi:hypothetical protein